MSPEEQRKELDKLHDDLNSYLNFKDGDPAEALYHYTSLDGLKGILKTRRLWSTDYRYLNDPSEIKHGKKIISDFFEGKFSQIQDKKLVKKFRYCLDMLGGRENRLCYITSFCEEGDHLLAWRCYGNDGGGFSIGFKKEFFQRIEKPYDGEQRG